MKECQIEEFSLMLSDIWTYYCEGFIWLALNQILLHLRFLGDR